MLWVWILGGSLLITIVFLGIFNANVPFPNALLIFCGLLLVIVLFHILINWILAKNTLESFLGKTLTEDDLLSRFEEDAHYILKFVETKKTFLSILFPDVSVAELALEAMRGEFSSIAKLNTRKAQLRKLLGLYYLYKQEAITFKYFSEDCPNELLLAHSSNQIELGDYFLNNVAIVELKKENNEEKFYEVARAHFKRKEVFEEFRLNILLVVIEHFSGKKIDNPNLPRFELLVKEHVKKIGVELLLKNYKKDDTLIKSIAEKYNFSETTKRVSLLQTFIQGIETGAENTIEYVCQEFPKLLEENYELFQQLKDRV